MREAEPYAREIVPTFNAYAYFRVGYRLARRCAEFLYRVRLGYVDDAAGAAIDSYASAVFMMNRRSNMDCVLVAYLAATRTALSYVVGERARNLAVADLDPQPRRLFRTPPLRGCPLSPGSRELMSRWRPRAALFKRCTRRRSEPRRSVVAA